MDLFDYLTPDTIVLTPNRRLSATFLKLHQQQQLSLEKTSWPTLAILPFPSWVQRLWQDYIDVTLEDAPALLTPNQEQIIWEDIISQSEQGGQLLQLSSTAELAKAAWGTLKQWRIDRADPGLQTTEDSRFFQAWAQRFQEKCEKQHWLDSNSVTQIVCEKIRAGVIAPPAHLLLLGFTEISPLYTDLLAACDTAGGKITHYIPAEKNRAAHRLGLKDEETEIRAMARWAKALWEKNPAQRIGCIFPRLEDLRDNVIKLFSEVFAEAGTYCLNYTRYPFNISAGKNLSTYPVIHSALRILNLRRENIPLPVINHLLLTPFIGFAESERLARAKFAMELTRANAAVISLSQLLNPSGQHRYLNLPQHCPALAALWDDFRALNIDKKPALLPSAWVDIFMRELTAFNWPGERSLNSHEYQVVDSWLKLLKEFSVFDNTLGKIDYPQALHYLTYLTTKKIFQPESPDAPIQILGMLEAAELPFDFIWVMGMDDTAWPPAPKPNPFIPQRLQKLKHMPHATAERELLYCQQLTAQLQRGAPVVIFSYAQLHDETELRPSPIISHLPEISLETLTLTAFETPAQRIYATKNCELLTDEIAPRIAAGETIRGGAAIFKLQAQCPFKAFAELRLHAKQIDPVTPGLRHTERGTLTHKAMEIVWNELVNSKTLQATDAAALQEIIKSAAESAIAHLNASALFPVRYRALESLRLQKIISAWMRHERQRPPFKVIAQELVTNANFSNIPIVLRIDRIDQLDDGGNIIIDYKTGKAVKEKKWFGDRPDEPQLPLYCVLDPEKTIGILFAQLNAEEMGFVGISAIDLEIKNVKPLEKSREADTADWHAQIRQWHTTLTQLADNFSNGHARVDPKYLVETCKNCHLHSLCRIHEVLV
jgi:ATP-dependent helicase/nuclease subunit B